MNIKKIVLFLLLLATTTACGNRDSVYDELSNSEAETRKNNSIDQPSSSSTQAKASLDLAYELPKWARLVAQQPNSKINLRLQPSSASPDKGYGLVGDLVKLIERIEDKSGSIWYLVEFEESGAEGWIRSDFIDIFENMPLGVIPQGICGDLLVDNYAGYPLEIYPLYVEYIGGDYISPESKEDMQVLYKLRNELCDDAHIGFIRGGEESVEGGMRADGHVKYVVMLGRFTDKLRAQQAEEKVNSELSLLDIEEKVIANVGNPVSIKEKLPSMNSVAEGAKLSAESAQALIAAHQDGSFGVNFDAVVPTYIPSGYEVESIEIKKKSIDNLDFRPYYDISYESLDGSCFSVSGATGRGGAGADNVQYEDVDSSILGRVTLMYIEFSRDLDGTFLEFEGEQMPSQWGGSQLYSFKGCKSTISLREAVKVVESLAYLNHPLTRTRSN